MLLYNLYALFKAIINQILIWGKQGRLFMTLPWLCSECGGRQQHPQLQFIGFTITCDEGARKDCQQWMTGSSIPVTCQISQVWMQACLHRGTQPGLEGRAEERQSGQEAGISTIRSEVSRSPGVPAGGQLCWGHRARVRFPQARGGGYTSPGRAALRAAPARPAPGRLRWGLAKMPLFCWVCSAEEEESVCGLLAYETLSILLRLSFSVTELQQFVCCPGQACLNLHKRKLTLRILS